jgi:hypothetical protein
MVPGILFQGRWAILLLLKRTSNPPVNFLASLSLIILSFSAAFYYPFWLEQFGTPLSLLCVLTTVSICHCMREFALQSLEGVKKAEKEDRPFLFHVM